MNRTTAIFIMNDDVTAVAVSYEKEDKTRDEAPHKRYTFKTFLKLEVDDIVVIPTSTRHGYTCAKVKEIAVRIDLDSTIEYKWIVQKVEIDSYIELLSNEEAVVDKMDNAALQRKRRELRHDLNVDSELAGMKLVTAPTAIEHTPDTGGDPTT